MKLCVIFPRILRWSSQKWRNLRSLTVYTRSLPLLGHFFKFFTFPSKDRYRPAFSGLRLFCTTAVPRESTVRSVSDCFSPCLTYTVLGSEGAILGVVVLVVSVIIRSPVSCQLPVLTSRRAASRTRSAHMCDPIVIFRFYKKGNGEATFKGETCFH